MARISRRAMRDRIVAYLRSAAEQEDNRHYWDDYCISWMTVAEAAKGNPQPDVWASYMHLGLHPQKVWPAVVARQKAQLGKFYEKFYDEAGKWRRGDADEDVRTHLSPKLPPKKPVRSVRVTPAEIRRVAGMEGALKTRSGGDSVKIPAALRVVDSPPFMASTARAYPNSDASSSAKKRVLSRAELENIFEECDLPRHLVNFIMGAWRAAGKPFGTEDSVHFFATVEGYRIEGRYRSERTVRYNLRKCEQLGILEKVYSANSWIRANHYRHTATHRLNISSLRRRQTYRHFKENRPVAQPIPPQRAGENPATANPAPVAPLQPTAIPVNAPGRSHARQSRQLTPREGRELVKELIERMRGHTSEVNLDRLRIDLNPAHPRYRPPMSQESALITACQLLGIPYESAVNHLKLCQWKFEGESPPAT